MVFPAIKLHHLYSINIYEGLDIILEDLNMLDVNALKSFIYTKNYKEIDMIANNLFISIENKTINFTGYKINDTTYMITRDKGGMETSISYECPDKNIITTAEYLYHMYHNLVM